MLTLSLSSSAVVARPQVARRPLANGVTNSPRMRIICASQYANLLPGVQEQAPNSYNTNTYSGATAENNNTKQTVTVAPLDQNKRRLQAAFDACDVSQNFRAVMLAVALQESSHADIAMRDTTKDGNYLAANATIFNLNVDLIQKTGYFGDGVLTKQQFDYLNSGSDDALKQAVGIMKRALELWGIENTLAFVRGGGSAFNEFKSSWRSYTVDGPTEDTKWYTNTLDYLVAIRTYMAELDRHPNYFTDAQRPDIYVRHI